MQRTRALAAAALAVALVGGLAGCAPDRSLEPEPTVTTAAPQPEPTVAPTFDPLLTATENHGYFNAVNTKTVRADGEPLGRDFIDGLVDAGFPKAAMEVTFDKTAINLDADNVQFSVLIDGDCLVGQFGNVGYQSAVLPVLSTGACLVGNTRPIDW